MHKKVLDVALFAIFLAGSSCWKYALAQAVLHEQNKDNLEFSHSTADSMFTERPLDMAASFLHSQRVLNPVQLFQGINPGLSVVRPGGNVFEGFRVRGRGLMSFETHNNEPLYIIDGMPVFHMDMLDPFWVSSISSDLDAFSSVRYGLRGNRPVLSFNSKSAPILKELTVDFETRLSSESIGRRIPIADRQTFLNFGGDDLGADTDWMEEVSRTGFSQEYNLDLSYQNKTSVLRLSGTYRNINPVLKTTNGKWLNGHVSYRFQDRKERLNFGLRSWLHHRENEYGFPEAFHFARVYNPSAPIRDSQSDRFDGYYQRIQFNYYNPVAMLEQNS
jgi:iron complex outermembrane receptor protein